MTSKLQAGERAWIQNHIERLVDVSALVVFVLTPFVLVKPSAGVPNFLTQQMNLTLERKQSFPKSGS